jgi:hypothetical protein
VSNPWVVGNPLARIKNLEAKAAGGFDTVGRIMSPDFPNILGGFR